MLKKHINTIFFMRSNFSKGRR